MNLVLQQSRESFQKLLYHDKKDTAFAKPKTETIADQLDKSLQKVSPQTASINCHIWDKEE